MASFIATIFLMLVINQLGLIDTSKSCNLTLENQGTNTSSLPIIGKVDKRDYIEYIVSYKYDGNQTVDVHPTNTSRLQPLRWFNINDIATIEIQLIYENFFYIFRSMFNIHIIHLDIYASPRGCLENETFQDIEDKTRSLLLSEIKPRNSKICAAYIEDNYGTGTVVFKCCDTGSSTQIECETIREGSLQYNIQILCITAAALVMIGIACLLSQSSVGSKNFNFYPKNMKVKVISRHTDDGEPLQNTVCCPLPDRPLNGVPANTLKTVKRITLKVPKCNCVDEGNYGMSVIRCLTDILTDLTSSYCKPGKGCSCSPQCRLVLSKICLAICLLVIVPPLGVILYYTLNEDTDYKQLCNAYKENSLKCPFYVKAVPLEIVALLCLVLYGVIIIFYVAVPTAFPAYILSDLRNNGCKKDCNLCCNILGVLSLLCILVTWGCVFYFLFYCIARVIVISSRTRNVYDDIALALLPMLVVIRNKFLDVTNNYKVITRNLLNLARKEETFNDSLRVRNEDSERVRSEDSKNTENIAVIIPLGSTAFNPDLKYYCCQLRLKFNLPLIFVQPKEPLMISKRIISLMYSNTSSDNSFELNNYLKVLVE